MSYYLIRKGEVFDANLYNFAKFKTRGSGDGRISKEDAQAIFRVAMDGGRLTEIEEKTFEFLENDLNWTDAAKEWLEEELTKEHEKLPFYYRIIDGLKYDRRILAKAEELNESVHDNQISLEDAKALFPFFADFGDIRIEEERALKFLFQNYRWSDKARNWFMSRYHPISKESHFNEFSKYLIRDDYSLRFLKLQINTDAITQQTIDYENKVDFLAAFRSAIEDLLYNGKSRTFKDALQQKFGFYAASDLLQRKTAYWLNEATLTLLFENKNGEIENYDTPPENEEQLKDNWIFGLEIEALGIYNCWVIVDRRGDKETYNYLSSDNFRTCLNNGRIGEEE